MSEGNVYVTNRDSTPLRACYAFDWYTFPVGSSMEVSAALARHVFGWQQDDKTEALIALGFVKDAAGLGAALERLALYEIGHTPPTNRSQPSAVGVVPLPAAKRAGGDAPKRVA